MSSTSAHNHQLSMDREFRYILQWFAEWSEIQREDFVPVLLECLVCTDAGSEVLVHVNGVLAAQMAQTLLADKPMSLFQCRVKLFREWSSKWPVDLKHKLRDKCQQIDIEWSERFANQLDDGELSPTTNNGHQQRDAVNTESGAGEDDDGDDNNEAAVAVEIALVNTNNNVDAVQQLSAAAMNLQNGPVSA